MSVVGNHSTLDGLYVPFRGVARNGIVGTFHIRMTVTGDSGGGTAEIRFSWNHIEFGFHALLVPTLITARDNLASAENVQLEYVTQGNERIEGEIEVILVPSTFGALHIGAFQDLGIVIEGRIFAGGFAATGREVVNIKWTTNTDAKLYVGQLYGVVYDAEHMAKYGMEVGPALSGIR